MPLSKQKTFDRQNPLGETSVEDFLNHYWQKKPLVIRNAFPDLQSPLQSPISADELAGLACEEHVNARLVIEKHENKNWQLEFGPFQENRFSKLPESGWSLLVSDVEKHFPESKFLLNAFRFIPDWRVDDLMISYAPTGSSVGAHTDAYDVFLIQLSGERLWKISEHYSPEVLSDTDLRILKIFNAEQEWRLNAGDMLYLPPNVAHHGIAQEHKNQDGTEGQCMTASVGFRTPSIKSMTSDYIHFVGENTPSNERYRDTAPVIPSHHAEITENTVSQFIEHLKQGLTLEREQVKQWLGKYCSDNKAFEDITAGLAEIQYKKLPELSAQSDLSQSPYSHFLFSHGEKNTFLFVDGISYVVSKNFAEIICNEDEIDAKTLRGNMSKNDAAVLLSLLNNGSVLLD
jgi:50S ribosomal protein L16 3-hydroxylase